MRSDKHRFPAAWFLAAALPLTLVGAAHAGLAEDVLAYVEAHREDVALVSYTATPDGDVDSADPAVFHGADSPRVLASSVKVSLVTAYAREVAAGRIDPEEAVSMTEWERYFDPFLDGGIHRESLLDLGIACDEIGFALDPGATVPLDRLVAMVLEHSDNPGADLLLERVGERRLRETFRAARLLRQELPISFVGLRLLVVNHEIGVATTGRLRELAGLSRGELRSRARAWARRYAEDQAFRLAEWQWWATAAPEPPAGLLARAVEETMPRGTAREYAALLARAATGRLISPAISEIVLSHLSWPLENPDLAAKFARFGAKGGSIQGVVTDGFVTVPKAGPYAGRTRLTVVFFRHLPNAVYQLFEETSVHQVFLLKLGTNRGFSEEVERRLEGPPEWVPPTID